MPAVRLSRRRRSSIATAALNPVKPGYYGVHSPSHSPRPVTFAPNVTPGTYVEPDQDHDSSMSGGEPGSPSSSLFPPSELPQPAPSRRRQPPGKRRSMGYIPRPPNAFMLFRADFVRQKHVPGSIETNHGSLSKIIGNCWRSLPLDEKHVWEVKAKHAKAEHKVRYPEYRFRPVHNKNKDKKKDKTLPTPDDERRCEEVAQLLLEGKKGDDLAAAVRRLDRGRTDSPMPLYPHRRSSSVPLPAGPIALPSLPFLSLSRPSSPSGVSQSASSWMMGGQRRSSSARPYAHHRTWTSAGISDLTRDESPLPEVDSSLFEQSYFDSTSGFAFPSQYEQQQQQQQDMAFNFNEFMSSLPPNASSSPSVDLGISPLDSIAPHDLPYRPMHAHSHHSLPELDPLSWVSNGDSTNSNPSSAYSDSPALSESSLPLHAPRPQHLGASSSFDMWKELSAPLPGDGDSMPHLEYPQDVSADLAHYQTGLDSLFGEPSFGRCDDSGMGNEHQSMDFGFQFGDMINNEVF
ncbi:hypothetical protein PLICRDRAFT_176703 [Plicaturopsis crispa FD-325 SS-3]|nr:hypothetical protein PLICRDRAFT_176703 [Plicaturopsis crispa FD-325 SS-3]